MIRSQRESSSSHCDGTGERKVKRCPSSGVWGGSDATTVRLDNGTCDRQSQAGALRLGSKERVKDPVSLPVRQPHARLGHRHQRPTISVGAIALLAHDGARWITGQVFR
jgi:hypothetical protein